jgi:hypothetical protein
MAMSMNFVNENVNLDKGAPETASNSVGIPSSILQRYASFMLDIEKLKGKLYSQNWEESLNAADQLAAIKSDESIAVLVQALKSDDNFIRNAASLGIRDADDSNASKALFDRIIELGAREEIGTLVYSLETFNCSRYLLEIINLYFEGTYEVQASTSTIMEEQIFTVSYGEFQQVAQRLKQEGMTVEELRIKYTINEA